MSAWEKHLEEFHREESFRKRCFQKLQRMKEEWKENKELEKQLWEVMKTEPHIQLSGFQ
jgi:hypothetical protein